MRVRVLKSIFLAVALLLLGNTAASANSILDGWAFNLDGVFTHFDPYGSTVADFPVNVNGAAFDAGTIDLPNGSPNAGSGTGTIVATVVGPGTHTVITWLDVHLDDGNGGYWYADEFGDAVNLGLMPAGTIWEIDEPGYGACDSSNTSCYTGSAYHDVRVGSLSNANNIAAAPMGSGTLTDVSLALGRTFTLGPRQRARVTFTTGYTSSSGFYLTQQNVQGTGAYYMTSDVTFEATPEPKAWGLMLSGAVAIAIGKLGARRRMRG